MKIPVPCTGRHQCSSFGQWEHPACGGGSVQVQMCQVRSRRRLRLEVAAVILKGEGGEWMSSVDLKREAQLFGTMIDGLDLIY